MGAGQQKFSDYLFKTPKAAVFKSLGYSAEDALELSGENVQQAASKYARGVYRLGKLDKLGQRIDIDVQLAAKGGGEVRTLTSGWLIRSDDVITRNAPLG